MQGGAGRCRLQFTQGGAKCALVSPLMEELEGRQQKQLFGSVSLNTPTHHHHPRSAFINFFNIVFSNYQFCPPWVHALLWIFWLLHNSSITHCAHCPVSLDSRTHHHHYVSTFLWCQLWHPLKDSSESKVIFWNYLFEPFAQLWTFDYNSSLELKVAQQ